MCGVIELANEGFHNVIITPNLTSHLAPDLVKFGIIRHMPDLKWPGHISKKFSLLKKIGLILLKSTRRDRSFRGQGPCHFCDVSIFINLTVIK